MKLGALALAALLLVPLARAQSAPVPAHPPEILALLPPWIDALAQQATPADREQPWWAQAQHFLTRAQDARDAGRFRSALFHAETFEELLIGNRLLDEVATLPATSERKAVILQRTSAWNDEATRAWEDFRAKLHEYDGDLRSLHTIEEVLYASDLALAGALNDLNYDAVVQDLASKPSYTDQHVFALVHSSLVALHQIERARDVLGTAVKDEGLPPRIDDAKWTELATTALTEQTNPTRTQAPLALLVRPVRENAEATMAVAMLLADQRAGRAANILTIYGDARARGLDVITDSGRAMSKQLNETSYEAVHAVGAQGVFTSDAIDVALLMREYVANGNATLETIVSAWAGLDHQGFVTNVLAHVSPIVPTASPTEKTPGPAPWLVAIALVGAALLARRARKV